MPVKSNQSFNEGLQQTLQDIALMKTMPDGDVPFLVGLETQVIDYIKQRTATMVNGGMFGPPQQQGQGGGPGGMPGGGPPPGMQAGPPPQQPPQQMQGPNPYPNGLRGTAPPGAAPPNPDEIRRMIGGGGVQGG